MSVVASGTFTVYSVAVPGLSNTRVRVPFKLLLYDASGEMLALFSSTGSGQMVASSNDVNLSSSQH